VKIVAFSFNGKPKATACELYYRNLSRGMN